MLVLTRRQGERVYIGPVESPSIIIELAATMPGECVLIVNNVRRRVRERDWVELDSDCAAMVLRIDSRSNRIRIGIEAPRDTPIHRESVALRIARENRTVAARQTDASFARQVAAVTP